MGSEREKQKEEEEGAISAPLTRRYSTDDDNYISKSLISDHVIHKRLPNGNGSTPSV